MIKIGLKQKKDKEGIIVEALLNSEATGIMMSLEFVRKSKFRRKS